jgi:hypothetical protein
MKLSTILFALLCGSLGTNHFANAQDSDTITYLAKKEAWRVPFMPVGPGNGVFLSPDAKNLVAISIYGDVTSLDPLTGKTQWYFTPTLDVGATVSSTSGVTFGQGTGSPFLVFSVIEEIGSKVTW